METYTYYPPQTRSAQVPYHILARGTSECQHKLRDEGWCDRISVQDGIVFVTFSCKDCDRQICQSLDEVMPPAVWTGARV